LTVVGEVAVRRRYYSCRKCPANAIAFDAWAGLGAGMVTLAARRMLALAGMSFSFDIAAWLAELCLGVNELRGEGRSTSGGEKAGGPGKRGLTRLAATKTPPRTFGHAPFPGNTTAVWR